MASFESIPNTARNTWINQSTSLSTEQLDEERDEIFVLEFPSYDSLPIYLINSDLKETVFTKNFSIAAIELINNTGQFSKNFTSTNSSVVNSKFESLFIFLQSETLAGTLSILLAVFLYTLSLLTILGNAIVVYAILTERKLRTVSFTFFIPFQF